MALSNVNMTLVGGRGPLDWLAPTGFRFSIQRIPTASYTVQKCNIPGLSLAAAESPNPFVSIPYPGEHVLFNEFRITFIVDQDLKNYLDIWKWLAGLGFPDDFGEYAALPMDTGNFVPTSEATLLVLDSKKNPREACVLHDAWPTSISDLVFDTTTQGVQYITADCAFRYRNFEVTTQGI
jgi:hypothetical protein